MIATTQIRPAGDADLAGIEQLLTENDLPLDGVRAALGTFVVAEADGDLVGVAGLEICCGRSSRARYPMRKRVAFARCTC